MRLTSSATLWSTFGIAILAANLPFFTPPTDVQMPGTQPGQVPALMGPPDTCSGCHAFYDPIAEPGQNWMGSMMAHSSRDPVFYAALAIAEHDIPGSGDFCLRCHVQRAWHEGRVSNATDGSALDPVHDVWGIECSICHQMVNPDTSEHAGLQTAPFLAHDGGTPPEGYYGNGMTVLAGDFIRHGPYAQTTAPHGFVQSAFMRDSAMCGTCHEVSNPLVGDLANNHGAQQPLPPGTFSGVFNSPVQGKAAFNNFPYQYGVVERTFSEHQASAIGNTAVKDYATLPADLQRGAIKRAYDQSVIAGQGGDYQDGTERLFSCQTCHIEPVVGEGAAFGLGPLRYDMPRHDLTGGNTWVPQAIQWLDNQNRLVFGGGLTPTQVSAMDDGVERARATLQRAAALDVGADSVRITNLTGHKLITGYPEGRRMWLRVRWLDEQNNVLGEEGSYESFQANVAGTNFPVSSITDPNARVYEAKFGISQDWAQELLALGVPPLTPLSFDRVTGNVEKTLIQLAADPAGTVHPTFHFILNNTLISDNRIPPYGMDRDEAATRNALPVPATQFGNPGPGGTYEHFDDVALAPPAGATRAEIDLLYQTASWEYIQFLRLANPGTNAFLGGTGVDVFDAWRNTGQSTPEVMARARWCDLPGTGEDVELRSSKNGAPADTACGKELLGGDSVTFEVTSPNNTHVNDLGGLVFQVHDASTPPAPTLPGIWLDRADAQVLLIGASTTPTTHTLTIPTWFTGLMIRTQAIMLSTTANNGIYAASDALDVWVE